MEKTLPEDLYDVHDWTDAAGELGVLAKLDGAELDAYVTDSAANAATCITDESSEWYQSDITEASLRELAAWLRK